MNSNLQVKKLKQKDQVTCLNNYNLKLDLLNFKVMPHWKQLCCSLEQQRLMVEILNLLFDFRRLFALICAENGLLEGGVPTRSLQLMLFVEIAVNFPELQLPAIYPAFSSALSRILQLISLLSPRSTLSPAQFITQSQIRHKSQDLQKTASKHLWLALRFRSLYSLLPSDSIFPSAFSYFDLSPSLLCA